MFLKGLKFNVLIHLGIIIAIAMLLVDLVLMTAFNNMLTNNLVAKGNLLVSAVQVALTVDDNSRREFPASFKKQVTALAREAGLECMMIMDKNHRPIFSIQSHCPEFTELESLLRKSVTYDKNIRRFSGATWGVFWKQKEYLAMASPIHNGPQVVGGAGMIFHLESLYQSLRHIQNLLWSYMIVNLTVLTLIGLYQISKVAINPLKRILNRAETYKEDEEIFFMDDIKTNEFNRLSSALNRMLLRISEDKARLKTTILSLENANAELKQAQQEVIRCEKAASVGRLSSGIAHEIGNPLGIILGYLDLLKHGDLTEREKEDFFNRLEKEIKRINTIIRQLLDFSRPGMGKSEPVSVHHVIADLVDMAGVLPLMRNIELTFSDDAPRDMIMGDGSTLRQVLLNLLINAADAVSTACPSGTGKISILTQNMNDHDADSHTKAWMAVIFKDNGGGIPKEDLDNIFDPFFTTKDPGKGTGLGLWVSYIMVENMGGKIEVSSKIGKGTEMTVKLPLIQ